MLKKSNKAYVFLAVQREKLRIIDLHVSSSRDQVSYQILENRLIQRYHVEYLCSDEYGVYVNQIIAEHHSETCLLEAKNSSLRDNLARLNRRTKKYSKSLEMLELSIYLLVFFKNFGYIDQILRYNAYNSELIHH